jgi:hypothetical protein
MNNDPHARKFRALRALEGKPCRIKPDEYERLMKHLRDLHAAGMSGGMIGRQAGKSASWIEAHLAGKFKSMTRTNYDLLMATELEEPHGSEGPLRDITGVKRRLQALYADGFPYKFQAEMIGMDISQVSHIAHPRGKQAVTHVTEQVVQGLYRKLCGADPADYGLMEPMGAKSYRPAHMSRARARKAGYAPSWCWDDDTIDDPAAIPEWTGRCGTQRGYNLHYNYGIIPVCKPCAEAHWLYSKKRGRK